MYKTDIAEAAPIVQRMLTHLAACIPPAWLAGSQARTALGDTAAIVTTLLGNDALGPPLANCFALVRQAGATQPQIDQVRVLTTVETPKTLGGILVQNAGIYLCMATEAQIIAGMTFTSRQDVEAVRTTLRQPFDNAEELAADDMDQTTFMALVSLDAAITNYLVVTARPLPRMIGYQFAASLPSLVIAYRLYQDASRADQVVQENKVVHPAFCPAVGIALSA
jgi:prophage DNA circulation protein